MIYVVPQGLYNQSYNHFDFGIRIFDVIPNFKPRENELLLIFPDDNGGNNMSFNKIHIESILNFIQKHSINTDSKILIHCLAGLSRSPAVAYGIKDYILSEQELGFYNNPIPNAHVSSVFRNFFNPY